MVEVKYELGQKVRDKITGFEGTILCVARYYNGCVRYSVQPKISKDGSHRESEVIDQEQLDLIPEKGIKVPKKNHGGDRPGLPKFKL